MEEMRRKKQVTKARKRDKEERVIGQGRREEKERRKKPEKVGRLFHSLTK